MKVSVIIPAHGVEKYIEKSIKSVINQTFPDFELIIVIDGSKDKSEELARNFERLDERVKVYNKPNGGSSDARNFGIDKAIGEFIYFLDADDWIEPKLLEDNLKIIQELKSDFVIFGFYQDNENTQGQLISQINYISQANKWINGDCIHLQPQDLHLLGFVWNKIYKKDYIIKHNIRFERDVALFEDFLFNAQVYQYANQIVFNQKAYVHYIQRPVISLTKQFHEKSFEWTKLRHSALKNFLEIWSFENKEEILANDLISGLRYCILNLFRFKNQLSFKEKIAYLDKMLNDKDLVEYSKFYTPISINSKIYYKLIKMRLTYAIALMARLRH